MSNRSMDRRIATNVADAQNLERLGLQDIILGLPGWNAADRFRAAADTLLTVTFHCDKRTRREVLRHANRLHAKANRLYRAEEAAGLGPRSVHY